MRIDPKLHKAAATVCPPCPARSSCGGPADYCNAVHEKAGLKIPDPEPEPPTYPETVHIHNWKPEGDDTYRCKECKAKWKAGQYISS